MYAADSYKATVWTVPVSGGTAKAWLTDPALAPDTSAAVPLGANGLRFHKGAVWVSNFTHGTLLRIPVTADGTPGQVGVVSQDLPGVDDFSFLDPTSDVVLAAQNLPNEVTVVYPDGTTRVVLTALDGLASPTATAVHGTTLYVTDGGLVAPHQPKLQTGRINPSALVHDEDN